MCVCNDFAHFINNLKLDFKHYFLCPLLGRFFCFLLMHPFRDFNVFIAKFACPLFIQVATYYMFVFFLNLRYLGDQSISEHQELLGHTS